MRLPCRESRGGNSSERKCVCNQPAVGRLKSTAVAKFSMPHVLQLAAYTILRNTRSLLLGGRKQGSLRTCAGKPEILGIRARDGVACATQPPREGNQYRERYVETQPIRISDPQLSL